MKIASLGAGRMATALLSALVKSGLCSGKELSIASRTKASRERLAAALGAHAVESPAKAVDQADVVLVCVKPQSVGSLLEGLSGVLHDKLVVSIAAGIDLASLVKWTPKSRHIRVMPNTPVEIGQGATAYTMGTTASISDMRIVRQIFESVGQVFEVEESMMDVVTALSGSGPAYFFMIYEILTEAAVGLGIPRDLALPLILQTGKGATELAMQSACSLTQLRQQVTSPRGTTAAAIEVMEAASLRKILQNALNAAVVRSKELRS